MYVAYTPRTKSVQTRQALLNPPRTESAQMKKALLNPPRTESTQRRKSLSPLLSLFSSNTCMINIQSQTLKSREVQETLHLNKIPVITPTIEQNSSDLFFWLTNNENYLQEYERSHYNILKQEKVRNVTSLEISGCFHKKIPILRNVQALVDTKLNFFRMTNDNENRESDFRTDQKMLRDLFVSLQHVEKLSIGSWCL
ncbi:hypothetical protein P3L10_010966 [Capsicum annuum]